MPDRNPQRDSFSATPAATSSSKRATAEPVSRASTYPKDAVEQVKAAASDAAATVTSQMKGLLDGQLGNGADVLGKLANSAQRAADDLDRDAPQIAGLVRTFANQMNGYAGDLRDQSLDDLMKTAGDFTRRQPAVVFGLAALAGFFALRVLKSGGPVRSPSLQPEQSHGNGRRSGFHGA
jgi:hypothetical protein